MIAKRLAPQKKAIELLMQSGFFKPAVDVEFIATEHLNIPVIKADIPDDISGVLDVDPEHGTKIFINIDITKIANPFP